MGQKRGRGEGSFVRETSAQAVEFYRDLVQNLRPWQARAPRLRVESETAEKADTPQAVAPAWAPSQGAGLDIDSALPGSVAEANAQR